MLPTIGHTSLWKKVKQNYYASLEKAFDVLTLFNVKITVKTKYQMSIDYSTSFWVNYSEHTFLKHDK